jgi:NTE family protein
MYGLVLEGGGAKGAYHVGAYKALKELNIEIGGIAGTSIGAINGAMMVQGDYELLEKVWYSVNSYELFDIDEKAIMDLKNFNLHDVNFSYLLHQSKEIPPFSIISPDKMKKGMAMNGKLSIEVNIL